MPEFDTNEVLTRMPGPGAGRSARPRRQHKGNRALAILPYLDVVLVVVAVPVALALGAPAVGVVVSAAAWLIQRVLASAGQRWIAGRGAEARFGLNLVDGFGRIWLLAGAIVLAAVIGGRRDGLAAALLIFCAYSIAFAMRLVSGRPQGAPQR
ncbi:MAG TPA: hypothetical protein VK778_03360 [Solirubrobacteraceae bacterium]|jgi:hypothetical protein|nr:hypothetical protein [Solirubrobacteraceae bacterium]